MYVALKLLGAISALDDIYMKTSVETWIRILHNTFVPPKISYIL